MATFGIDYLIDYYALLDVPRGADRDTITAAFRKKQMQYHPDRFQGLAPELLREAEHQSNLLNDANATLTDEEKRPTYDGQLADWKRPLSRRGEVVIDITEPHFSFSSLLEHMNEDSGIREREAERLALQFSGFEKATYEFFRAQAETPGGVPDALKAAYLEQLERRDMYLSLREGFIWDSVGERNRSPTPRLEYVEQMQEGLSAAREKARHNVEQQVLLLTAGEQALLPAPDGLNGPVDAESVLAHYTARIEEHFAEQTKALEPLAAERESVLNLRFKTAAELAYHPDTVVYTRDVLLGMASEDRFVWVRMNFGGDDIRVTDAPSGVEQLEKSDNAEAAKRFMADGYTILTFKAVQGIDFMSQLNRVADLHAKKLEPTDESVE